MEDAFEMSTHADLLFEVDVRNLNRFIFSVVQPRDKSAAYSRSAACMRFVSYGL